MTWHFIYCQIKKEKINHYSKMDTLYFKWYGGNPVLWPPSTLMKQHSIIISPLEKYMPVFMEQLSSAYPINVILTNMYLPKLMLPTIIWCI